MTFDNIIEKQFLERNPIEDEFYIKNLYDRNAHDYSFKLFQIIGNKLYVKSNSFPEFETRFEAAKANILKLLDKYVFPDLEFVYFDGDSLNTHELILVSTSSREDTNSILLPDFTFQFWPETHLFDYPSEMDKILNSAESIGLDLDGWRSKKSCVFYRGSMNNAYREQYLSRGEHFLNTRSVLGSEASPGTPNFKIDGTNGCARWDKANYKFLLHLNGGQDTDYSSAFKFNLACCSLVFYATNSKQKEWWQNPEIFREGEHYVQVNSREDLRNKFNYFLTSEGEALRIARAGFDFVKKNLTAEKVEEYYRDLLLKHSSLLRYKIELAPGAIRVENYSKK